MRACYLELCFVRRYIWLLLLVPRLAAAQPEPIPTPEVCTSTIDGHVVESTSHEPVGGATVKLDEQPIAETDPQGRFYLKGLCPGDVTITIERLDCVPNVRRIKLGKTASMEIEMTLGGATEVIEVREKAPPPTDMRSTTVIDGAALERKRGQGLSETLAEVPGVAQLKSASGMAKPIIRGQYGRRLLILVGGVRHRAQEWGLDHAPEIDPFVAGALTVVRGASGVRYGPDAIGGAVLVDPPPLLQKPGFAGEAHLVGVSNGVGGAFSSRVQMAPAAVPGLAGQIEGSYKRLASPNTPDYALDNTGVHEWNLGATVGYTRGNHEARLSFTHYQAELGVCGCLRIESAEEFFANLERERPLGSELYESDAEIERASQAVAHDLAIARDTYTIENHGTLTTTLAFQHDHRREFDIVRESVTGPQYSFRMFTPEAELAYDHNPLHLTDHLHLRGTVGVTGMAQIHNYAGLQLVPDHRSYGAGAYAVERLIAHDFELEAGVRYDFLTRTASLERIDYLRLVREGQLAMDACDVGAEQADCDSKFHTLSASVGGLVRFTDELVAKLDLSTASRPPNTDEQYINGTSPTFPVLGLGKPDLGPETTYSAALTGAYRDDHVQAEASVFANYIDDYIYFAPAIDAMGNPIFDVTIRGAFPRFVTRPVDAMFYGADGGVQVTPVSWLELGAQASLVRARNRTDDGYLVFVPPDRVRGSVTFKRAAIGSFSNAFVSVAGTAVRQQKRFDLDADFAAPPDAYFLLGAELGAETKFDHQTLKVALQGSNLLDQRYRDYTSLLRYFADQPGWQLMLRLTLNFTSEKS
jgi:iron complex outermembrane receptor protein